MKKAILILAYAISTTYTQTHNAHEELAKQLQSVTESDKSVIEKWAETHALPAVDQKFNELCLLEKAYNHLIKHKEEPPQVILDVLQNHLPHFRVGKDTDSDTGDKEHGVDTHFHIYKMGLSWVSSRSDW